MTTNQTLSVISLRDAKATGLSRYFTGLPCPTGHIAPRSVSSRSCVICRRNKLNAYRATDAGSAANVYRARAWRSTDAGMAYRSLEHVKEAAKTRADVYLATPTGFARSWSAKCLRHIRMRSETTMTIDDLVSLWNTQGGRCAITGHQFARKPGNKWVSAYSPSLDRIDSKRGYEISNVRIVVFAYNALKGTMTDKETAALAAKIVDGLSRTS